VKPGPRPSSQSCSEVSHCINSPRQDSRGRQTYTSSARRGFARHTAQQLLHPAVGHFQLLPASGCVKCPCSTSCNTFNRSRSRLLSTSISCSLIRLVCRSPTGTFYFAGLETSHVAATSFLASLDLVTTRLYHFLDSDLGIHCPCLTRSTPHCPRAMPGL